MKALKVYQADLQLKPRNQNYSISFSNKYIQEFEGPEKRNPVNQRAVVPNMVKLTSTANLEGSITRAWTYFVFPEVENNNLLMKNTIRDFQNIWSVSKRRIRYNHLQKHDSRLLKKPSATHPLGLGPKTKKGEGAKRNNLSEISQIYTTESRLSRMRKNQL